MNVAQLTAAFVLAACALVPMHACDCSAANPDANEAAMPGGWSISVYRSDGTPASKVPVKAPASAAAGHDIGLSGGAYDAKQPGRLEILYVRVNFPDDTREWITKDDAYADCRRVADYYAENSYGAVQMSFDVTPLLTIPRSFLTYREATPWVGNVAAPTLIGDAAAVAAEVGYNAGNYDIIIVGHRTIFAANTGGGGEVQLQQKGWAVMAHEVGHAIGAGHSVFWRADGTSAHGARDWRAFAVPGTVDTVYHTQVEPYGDPWCIMGGGQGHFSLYWKQAMGWLSPSQMPAVTSSGRFRVTALDYPTLDPNRIYGLTITRNNQQTYYLGYRVRQVDGRTVPFQLATETWLPESLLVWGGPWDGSAEPNNPPMQCPYMIDTTPGSPQGLTATVSTDLPIDGSNKKDAGIQVGRTFSDSNAGIHVTVVDHVRSEPDALDIVVNLGTFPDNRKPTVTLTATGGTLSDTGQYMVAHTAGLPTAAIGFRAVATDADGDELAYWWDFGDVSGATENSDRVTHAWSDATVGSGRLLTVRVVVSDMKGGVASAILPINIGLSEYPAISDTDTTRRQILWARGRIVDQAGEPVEGMRVNWKGTPWKGTYTDSDGRYWLGQIENGAWIFEARSEALATVGINDASPLPSTINFALRDLSRVDFVAYKKQTITVSADAATVAPGGTAQFTLTRSFASPGAHSDPAPYTITDLTNVAAPGLLRVRLYTSTGALTTWQWKPVGSGAWQDLNPFANVTWATPEDMRQVRRESGPRTDPADANPTGDYYVVFPAGETAIQLRCPVGASVPAWRREVSLMVAHSPDYYADVNQAAVIVPNPSPAATPTVTLSATPASVVEGSGESILVTVSTDVPATERLEIPLSKSGGATGRVGSVPATLVIEPGQMSASCRLFTVDDTIAQGTESVDLTIAAGANYLGAPQTDSISIVDNDRQRVWITNTNNPAREDNGSGAVVAATFTVHRSGNLAGALVVRMTQLGSATPGTDYTMATSVTIPAGQPSADITLTPVADTTAEGDETVIVTLVQSNDVRVVNPGSATCIIQDKERPIVRVTGTSSFTINENGGEATFTLTRTGNTSGILRVPFSLSGTASYSANDYSFQPALEQFGVLKFNAGSSTLTMTIKGNDDTIRELNTPDREYVHLQLQRDDDRYNLVSGNDQVAVGITDDDGSELASVAMEQLAVSIDEPRSPYATRTLDIDIVWSAFPTEPHDLDNPVSALFARVRYEVRAITDADALAPADERAVAGVNFIASAPPPVQVLNVNPANTRTRRVTVSVPILADGDYSAKGLKFIIQLSSPENCVFDTVRSGGTENLTRCVVTINDVNSGFVTATATDATAVAGGAPVDSGMIRIERSFAADAPTNVALPVDLELRGNAVPGVDFDQIGSDATDQGWEGDSTMLRRFTIPANETFIDVPVTALYPFVERAARDLQFRVAAAPGYDFFYDYTDVDGDMIIIGAKNGIDHEEITISSTATDTRQTVSIAASDSVGYERSGNTVAFTLTRSATSGSLTVPLALSGWSNAVAADFSAVPASVTFASGSATASVTLTPVNEGAEEGTETAILAIVADGSANFRIAGSGNATAWIVDAEMPLPEVWLEVVEATVQEEDDEAGTGDGSRAKVRLFRSGEQAYPLTVTLNRTGTAQNGTDYAAIAGTVTIPAGAVSVDVEVDPVQDALPEGDETVVLTVASGTTYTARSGFASQTMTIVDDDAATVSIALQDDGAEGGAALTYVITRSCSQIGAALAVTIDLAGGTGDAADPAADLGTTSEIVTIAGGALTAVVTLPVVDDALIEPDESVLATVAVDPVGTDYVPAVDATGSAIGHILDNDTPRIAIAIVGTDEISEPSGSTILRVTRTAPDISADLTVSISLTGTATSGADYTATVGAEYVLAVGTVTIPAASASVDITLAAEDDPLVEDAETVVATLVADTGYLLDGSASTATVTITDDDTLRVGVVGPANFKPGSSFGGSLTYRFYRIGSTDGPLRVNFDFSGTCQEGTHFNDVDHFADMADGQDHVDVTLTLKTGYDTSVRRTLVCSVIAPVLVGSYAPGGVPGIAGGLLSSTTRILSTADTLLVKAVATVPSTTEGSLAGATVAFQANTSLGADRTVNVTRIPGVSTAVAGDYTLTPVMAATIPNGTTLLPVELNGIADYLESEPREYVLLALNQPVGDEYFSVGLPALFWINNTVPPQPDIVLRLNSIGGTEIGGTDAMAGTQKVGAPFIRRYYVVNEGSLPLTVTDVAIDAATVPSGCTATIDAVVPAVPPDQVLATGAAIRVDVRIVPGIFGVWNCGLVITSDDPDQPTVTTRIYGVGDKTTTDGTSSASANEGTGEGGPCGAGGMAGLLIGAGLLLAGVRRASRRKAA